LCSYIISVVNLLRAVDDIECSTSIEQSLSPTRPIVINRHMELLTLENVQTIRSVARFLCNNRVHCSRPQWGELSRCRSDLSLI